MVQGPRPNYARRQQVTELRRRGLTLAEIGKQLGVTRPAVYSLIHVAALPVTQGVPCTACHVLIPTPTARPWERHGALCLRCLKRTPGATTGQRLRAYRLAAGLSRTHVAWLTGIAKYAGDDAELDKRPLRPDAFGRVARLLGLPAKPSCCTLRLSSRAVRGLRVLLAVARAGSPQGIGGRRLAESNGVSLGAAVGPWRRAGLIATAKKEGYSYRLTRPAAEITLLDVAEAVGGSLRLALPRVPVKGGDKLHRRLQAACDDAAEEGRTVLRAVSLADLFDGE